MGDAGSIFAVIIDFFGTFLSQVGYIMMKKGMIKVEKSGLNGQKKKIPFFTCEWIMGLLLLGIGSLVHVAVLPFCDLVVLSTLSSIGIIMNNILSVLFLGERVVWKHDAVAIGLIIAGNLTIVFLSDYSETSYTPDDIHKDLFSVTTLVYTSIGLIFTAATIVQFIWHSRQVRLFNRQANQYLDTKLQEMQLPESSQ